MIITLTPNPALDITYRVGSIRRGESHRVADVVERAGGKGINTAAVLTAMGIDSLAVAPIGTSSLREFAADLNTRGVSHHLVATPGATRRSITVVDEEEQATVFNEAGAPLPRSTWDQVVADLAVVGQPGGVLTISGSLPPQTPDDLLSQIIEKARAVRMRVVVDVSGPALRRTLAAAPDLVKPNRLEATVTLGGSPENLPPATRLARSLVSAGAGAAVVSDGSAGLVLVAGDVGLRAWLPSPLHGNPTGAGDALTAALAMSLHEVKEVLRGRDTWVEVLRRGVAWSAAAVLQPVAGEVDPADVTQLMPAVEIEELP